MKSRLAIVLVVILNLAVAVHSRAQQPEDASAGQNGEPDLAAEVHQLKSEIDRLSRELERVSAELERLQNEHAAEQVVSAAPAPEAAPAPAVTPTAPAPAPSTPRGGPASPQPKPARGKAAAAKVASPPPAQPGNEENGPNTVLVFQDGRHIEARNYAIVGQTVWVYTEQDSKRFPLADLNVEETHRANAERGIAFQLPPTR
jgi:hypothetical protein